MSRSALEGERKQVTVLFADVRGSMDLAEEIDPEDWHRMMERFLETLAEGVHRYEGTVNQYTGDGIMALFGAPVAHEDHAQRACYAALHIRTALQSYFGDLRRERGLDFAVRFGMNSGEVVVGKIGDDLRMDYTAQGHTVGLAARVEQAAAADRIYLSEATAKLAGGYFELEDLGEFQLKGVSQSIPLHELTGVGAASTRLDLSLARGLSRFVGRAEEMDALESALAHGSEGQPRVIGIVAEAGAGKSRLCFEFLERCRARGIRSFAAHGVAHGKVTPLVPILELYRGFYGISDQDTDQQAREKIAGRLVLLDDSLRDEIPLMCDFLGVPDPERPAPRMDPEARQRRLFDLLRRIVQTAGEQQTTVTLLEDLHWFDGASDAFLDVFVSAVPGTKGILIVNFRPEYSAQWMRKTFYQQISLLPLGPQAISELLDDLLGGDDSLAGLAEHIHERTSGNPFFIEEVARSLAESGALEGSRGAYQLTRPVGEIAVPDSVRAVLAARIDRQSEREKQLLQTAAVIGKTFSERLLLAVGGLAENELRGSLAELERSEFVHESSLYPEHEYTFKHPLTQEVAYTTQLADRRRPIHAAVARELSELHADKLDEEAALLAHHWESAGEGLEAARWHQRAAEWIGTSDVVEAVEHWQSVCRLGGEQPDAPGAAELATHASLQLMNLAFRLGHSPDEEAALIGEAQRWVARSGSVGANALLHYSISLQRMTTGDIRESTHHAREAKRLAELSGDERLNLLLPAMLIPSLFASGALRECRALTDRVFEDTRDDLTAGVDLWGSSHHLFSSWVRAQLELADGDLAHVRQGLDRCVELSRAQGDAEQEIWALTVWGPLVWIGGDADAALPYARLAVQLADSVSGPFTTVLVQQTLACALLVSGLPEEATDAAEHSLQLSRERRVALNQVCFGIAVLAEALLALGRIDDAEEAAREGVAEGQRGGATLWQSFALIALARVLRGRASPQAREEARSVLAEVERLYAEMGARNLQAFVHRERAELAHLDGDPDLCASELRKALELFRTMNAPIRVSEVEARLGE
jgi:adenylate cyclase